MEKKLIQSVMKAVKIIEYVAKNNNIRLVDISKDLNINKSTLYGLVSTLEETKFLCKNYKNNTYSLGYKSYQLGKVYESKLTLKELVHPYLRKIAEKYKETTHLAIEEGNEILYVDKINSTQTIGITANFKNERYYYCTAVGKVFLAYMDEKRLKDIFKIKKLVKLTKNTIIDKGILELQLQDIKKLGYAYEIEETEMGLACIAAPIKQFDGKIVGGITTSIPVSRLTDSKLKEIGEYIIEVCDEISKSLEAL